MRSPSLLCVSVAMLLGGCSTFKPPAISYDDPLEPAVLQAEPPKPVEVVELPKPLPLPGQLKPLPSQRSKPEPRDPRQRVDTANAAARVQPTRSGYINAIQLYPFTEGALYQVYASPGQVTDIALQEGEQLVVTEHVLERQPGADPQGFAGLEDGVDHHWGRLAAAAALSTLLGVGAELGATNAENNLLQSLRRGAATSLNQTGQQVVRRNLNIQPTLTIRPGFPVRVIVNRDLVFR